MHTRIFGWCRRAAACFLLVTLAPLSVPYPASSQATQDQVRVPNRNANVHAGSSTASIVLVLVPQGTVLRVLERRGPWVRVELSPELKESATPMRWYRNEKSGFMHESTVEFVSP